MKKCFALLLALTLIFSLLTGFSSVSAEEPEQGEDIVSICLKDDWRVYVDSADIGEESEWYTGFIGAGKSKSIPFEVSDMAYTSVVWFGKTFTPELLLNENERVIIEFEGVQYYTKVWLNGNFVGDHEGSYGKFSMDITDYIRNGEENLLALRCYAPKPGNSHRGMESNMLPMWLGEYQHIQTPVYIKVVPQVSIEDTYVFTDYETGKVNVELTLENPGKDIVEVDVNTSIKSASQNYNIESQTKSIRVQPGTIGVVNFELKVKDFIPWDLDNPYLYDVIVELTEKISGYTQKSIITTGFKEFYVDDDGYFVLNGERIFLKSAHTAPYVIGSIDVGTDIERMLHQLDYLKSIGNNVVRFIDGPALPEMLDYCDRIGLMVYEETAMSWTQVDGPLTTEIFQEEMAQLLMRDRNHVSFGILGLLNETFDSGNTTVRVQTAVDSLEHIRSIDEEVLVLLSSGRWDRRADVASACNPGSTTWDGYMGNEGVAKEDITNDVYSENFGENGDIHFYPNLPYDSEIGDLFRAMGDVRAAFISENGAGSQVNIVSDYRVLEQENNSNIKDALSQAIKGQLDTFRWIYDNLGMSNIYPRLESFLLESEALQSLNRGLLGDYIRSNNKINGYSMTQGADIAYRGEGVLEGTMGHKEDMYDTLSDSWAPLKWCINLTNYNIYNDQPLELDIVLSDLGILENKEYTGLVQIIGENGTVYEKEFTVTPDGTFAFPVLNENVDVSSFATGEYKISCVLNGESVASSTKSFWVTQRSDMPEVTATRPIYAYDVPDAILNSLKSFGVDVKEIDKDNIPENAIILLGHNNTSASNLEPIFESVEKSGSHCIGIKWGVFGDYYELSTPFAEKFLITDPPNWLYHTDSVIYDTDITEGLQNNGIVSQIYYESVYDPHYYTTERIPDEIHSFSMFIGNNGGASGEALTYGYSCASYTHGKGTITLNAFDIEGGIGYPVADRLLLNMINYKG